MRARRNASGRTLAWAACLVALASPAQPQAAAAPEEASEPAGIHNPFLDMSLEELMEVRLTSVASVFEESELDVGSTVDRFDSWDWEEMGSRTTCDLLGRLPATLVSPSIFGGCSMSIRGYSNDPAVRGISFLLDGVPINKLSNGTELYNTLGLQLDALSRVEVIRGPGSAIHGADAFHGVVALTSFESEEDLSRFDLELGTDGHLRGALAVARQVSDLFRIDASVSASGQGDQHARYDYTEPGTGVVRSSERPMEFEAYMANLKMTWARPGVDSFRLGLHAYGHDADDHVGAGRIVDGMSLLEDRDLSGSDSSFAMAQLAYRRELPRGIVFDASAHFWQSERTTYHDATRGAGILIHADWDETRTGIKLALKQDSERLRTTWQVVLESSRASIDRAAERRITEDGTVVFDELVPADGHDRTLYGIGFQARTSLLNDKLDLVYGARLDDYSTTDRQLTPRLGLVIHPTPDLAVKLLYQEAYRAPTGLEMAGGGAVKGNPDIAPESIDSYELVLMHVTESSTFDVTLFHSEWTDAITLVPIDDPVHFATFVNTGENKSRGIEFGYEHRWDAFDLSLDASWVQSRNVTGDFSYGAFPRWIVNAGIGWRSPSRKVSVRVTNRIHLDADAHPVNPLLPSPEELSDYFRTDVHVAWRLGERAWLRFDVRNLFDRDNHFPSVWAHEDGVPDERINASLGFRWTW